MNHEAYGPRKIKEVYRCITTGTKGAFSALSCHIEGLSTQEHHVNIVSGKRYEKDIDYLEREDTANGSVFAVWY